MKVFFSLSLIFIFLTGNLFAQPKDSLQTQISSYQADSLKSSDSTVFSEGIHKGTTEKTSSKHTSSKDSGILIGSIVGAAAGVGVAAFLGSFSLEPSTDKKASFGELVLGGLIGTVIGGIVGGLVSK